VNPEKRKKGKYPKELRALAVERLKSCGNVSELAKELGIGRTVLYKWRERGKAARGETVLDDLGQRKLREENSELKRLLAEKTLEVDFFKGALQKVEARRQKKLGTGGTASTTKSGS